MTDNTYSLTSPDVQEPTAYTPGSWQCVRNVSDSGWILVSGEYHIARIFDINGQEENRANAELIASAPEMKAALDAIANSTAHADAAQKWECEKAELLNCLKDVLDGHEVYCACGGGSIAVEHDDERHNEGCVIVKAERVIAKYEAK